MKVDENIKQISFKRNTSLYKRNKALVESFFESLCLKLWDISQGELRRERGLRSKRTREIYLPNT